jgi:aminopeptidase-like protein
MPDAIPYRTTYYERDWGFCLRHNTFEAMDEDEIYQVYIDSDLDENGELTYADAQTEGRSDKEYIISTYCCHPSLANDNLSGLILTILLFDHLRERSTYHSYRLVVVPETIGAISYLNQHEQEMKAVDGGYVVTTVAGPGSFDYKESFEGDHPVDRAARWALADDDYEEHAFAPTGSDERQYSTPGFRIPTGTIAKNKYYTYDAYHTSKDDLSFISVEGLLATLDRYLRAIDLLEKTVSTNASTLTVSSNSTDTICIRRPAASRNSPATSATRITTPLSTVLVTTRRNPATYSTRLTG